MPGRFDGYDPAGRGPTQGGARSGRMHALLRPAVHHNRAAHRMTNRRPTLMEDRNLPPLILPV
jgi:hypothetical protein